MLLWGKKVKMTRYKLRIMRHISDINSKFWIFSLICKFISRNSDFAVLTFFLIIVRTELRCINFFSKFWVYISQFRFFFCKFWVYMSLHFTIMTFYLAIANYISQIVFLRIACFSQLPQFCYVLICNSEKKVRIATLNSELWFISRNSDFAVLTFFSRNCEKRIAVY